MKTRIAAACAAALIVLGGATAAQAQPRQPLPAFTVTNAAGVPVASKQLTHEDRWLLIYVSPDCTPCESLLANLRKLSSPALLSRAVLIVSGTPDKARAFVEQHAAPELANVAWYVDAEGKAADALQIKNSPALVGVRNGQVGWRLAGVLNQPSALQSVVRSWVEDRDRP
jgi:hypothetical protein